MRALILLSLVVLALAGKHRNSDSGDSSSSSDADIPAQQPSVCALYPAMPVEAQEEDDTPKKHEQSTSSSSYLYDPVQFLPNGGFYAADVSAPTYHFSFCSADPNPSVVEFCNSENVAVCAVVNGVGISLGEFSSQNFQPNEEYKKGYTLTYSLPKEASACVNGTSATFVMNCSRNFDPETNYTVTSAVMSEDGCGITFTVDTVAACPIYIEQTYGHRMNFNAAHNILMIAGIISLIVLVCSCFVLCCVCRKVARERCARNKAACVKKPVAPVAHAKVAPVAPVARQQPQPPVTPPPQQFQPQFPGYFVPAPQGMNPMYPNLYQGGYMPLVPMMQPMPAQNPFAQVTSAHVAQRSQQEAEDERLARALQAQFNQEQA